jgi:hypothetical protein
MFIQPFVALAAFGTIYTSFSKRTFTIKLKSEKKQQHQAASTSPWRCILQVISHPCRR